MLIREKLESYPFSNSEKLIIDYILKNKTAIKNMTTKDIANATYTSPSTLIRIAHKMKYKGWSELKNAFLQEEDYLETHFCNINANYPFDEKDSIMSIANKIAILKKETIEDTLSLITHDDLQNAIRIIRQSSYINVFAVSNNLLISQEFKHNMARIKKRVDICPIHGEQIHVANLADSSSCAIVISYSGETTELIKITQLLKSHHISVIAITNIGENSISKLADCILRITTREKLYSKIATYSTDEAIIYLLDVLYSCIYALDYENNDCIRYHSSRKIEEDRMSTLDIIKED